MAKSDTEVESEVSEEELVDSEAAESEQQPSNEESEAGQLEASQAEIEALKAETEAAKDQALRTVAEMQNLRRRTERDVESAHKFGQEKLINSLLPVLDNLDRALVSGDSDSADSEEALKSLIEGLELTRKSAVDALQKHSVETLDPIGEPFNPEFHEAMTMVPSDTAEPNSVIDVLQKGYTLNGRLLRAAMVVVAK